MDEKTKLEIALLLIKNMIKQKGFTVSGNSRRDYIDVAKKIGVEKEKLFQFLNEEIKPMLIDMINDSFSL